MNVLLMASYWTGQWELDFPQVFRTLSGQGCGESSAVVCHLVAEVEHGAGNFSQIHYSLSCVGFSAVLLGWRFQALGLSLEWQHLSHPWAASDSGAISLHLVPGVLMLSARGTYPSSPRCPLLTLPALALGSHTWIVIWPTHCARLFVMDGRGSWPSPV